MTVLPLVTALALAQLSQGELQALRRTVAVESAAVEAKPDDTDALYRLGLAWLTMGEPKKAIAPLEALVREDAEALDGKLLLVRAYRGVGDPDKAAKLLDQALLSFPDEVSLHAARAHLARSLDDNATAIAEYRKAVALAPGDAELHFNLGEAIHAHQKNVDEAIAEYRKALELDAGLTPARVNLGKALAEKGLFGEAKALLSAATKDTLADAEVHYNLGVILMAEGAVGAAATEFQRALAIDPKHAQAMNNLGVAHDAAAHTKQALDAFKKAVALDPAYAEAWFNLGMSYMKVNQVPAASRAFEKALKLEPESSGPYVQLGSLYLQQGKRDRAVEAFKQAITAAAAEEKKNSGFLDLLKRAERRRSTDAYRGLALAYLGQGKIDDAVATLRQAVEMMPKDVSARRAFADACLAQRNYDCAVEQLTERLALEPTTEARIELGRAMAKRGSGKEAEALFKEVLTAEPDNRDAAMGLADYYLAARRYPEAEALLQAALKSDADDVQALSRLGILNSRMGRPDKALEPLEKVVKRNPLLFDARAEYAFLLFRADPGNAGRCVEAMTDILTAEPRHLDALNYLGVCLFARGLKARAEEAFKAALNVNPDYAAAHYSLAQLYEDEGKKGDAAKEYEAASRLGHTEAAAALKTLQAAPTPTP